MEAQIYNAIIAGIVVLVGASATFIVAMFRWIPQRMNAQLDEYKKNEATRREVAKDKSESQRENEHADNRLKLAQAAMLEKQADFWQRILDEFRDGRSATDAHTIAVANNTQAVEQHGRKITGLTEEVGELRQKVEQTSARINNAVDKLPSNTAQLEGSINTLTDIARNITSAQVDLNLLMTKVNDAQTRLIMKKTDSQPIHIPKEMLDAANDDIPPA